MSPRASSAFDKKDPTTLARVLRQAAHKLLDSLTGDDEEKLGRALIDLRIALMVADDVFDPDREFP
jgi:hypothetical protein